MSKYSDKLTKRQMATEAAFEAIDINAIQTSALVGEVASLKALLNTARQERDAARRKLVERDYLDHESRAQAWAKAREADRAARLSFEEREREMRRRQKELDLEAGRIRMEKNNERQALESAAIRQGIIPAPKVGRNECVAKIPVAVWNGRDVFVLTLRQSYADGSTRTYHDAKLGPDPDAVRKAADGTPDHPVTLKHD